LQPSGHLSFALTFGAEPNREPGGLDPAYHLSPAMSDGFSDASSGRGGGVPTATRVRERDKVRRRRRRRVRKEPSALEAERWLTEAGSRRWRRFTVGSGAAALLVIGVYLLFRR
jgi:hypothetical protein